MNDVKLWIGVECTLNRVQDDYFSQMEDSGHISRIRDLKLFSELGAEKIRYPALWEQLTGKDGLAPEWKWLDDRLLYLKRLRLQPIIGFVHHGSGPRFTNLLDPQFPEKLSRFARSFARRYPWVEDYTPINEILTTARFSCLYGHWYPHRTNAADFVKAVYLQCKATVLAMREVRKFNPRARLIQTEDLGRTQSTEPLLYQRDFENERRFLALDFLCGKVDERHPLYEHVRLGLDDKELAWMRDNAMTPDIFGINHYHLSNRFLDHRLELYPKGFHGGNGQDAYVDVGAIDTGQAEPVPVHEVLSDVWNRYQKPIAVTEVHTRGYRESQMRWFHEVWTAANRLKKQGVDIRAVTAWSLLGSFHWNKLCTERSGFYEPGVFDLRTMSGRPKKTAYTRMIASLGKTGFYDHPVLEQKGWWHDSRRVLFAPSEKHLSSPLTGPSSGRPILITGGRGTLSRAFARLCALRNLSYRVLSREELDITNPFHIKKIFAELKPWAVINTAGYVKVDQAELETEKCFKENVHGAEMLAAECRLKNLQFVTFSSDLVFGGEPRELYLESHLAAPLNIYGHSKAHAEQRVMAAHEEALIIRTSAFFGPWDEYNFVTQCLRAISRDKTFSAAADVRITPTYIPDLVHAVLELLLDKESGLVHLSNAGTLSWAEFALMAAEQFNRNQTQFIRPCTVDELNVLAKRPANSSLGSERFKILPSLEGALERYFVDREVVI